MPDIFTGSVCFLLQQRLVITQSPRKVCLGVIDSFTSPGSFLDLVVLEVLLIRRNRPSKMYQ